MSLRPAIMISLCFTVALWGTAVPGVAQVQFLSPQQGSLVHGAVEIKATKPQPEQGWISYSIQPSNNAQLAAAMAPFSIVWNTQVYQQGQRVYPDGQYTITAAGFDGSGRRQGRDSVTITVANDIDPSEIGRTVELKANYQRGELFNYQIEGKTTVNVPGEAGKELREPPQMSMGMGMGMAMGGGAPGMMGGPMGGRGMPDDLMGGGGAMPGGGGMGMGMGMGAMMSTPQGLPSHIEIEIAGRWEEEVLSPSATGRAVVDKDLQNGYYTVSWLWPKEVWMEGETQKEEEDIPDSYAEVLPTAGGEYRFKVFSSAVVEKMHDEQPEFPLGQSFSSTKATIAAPVLSANTPRRARLSRFMACCLSAKSRSEVWPGQ